MIYGNALYEGREGVLVAEEDHLSFQPDDNGTNSKWPWITLEKISATVDEVGNPSLRIKNKRKILLFVFPDGGIIQSTKRDIKARIVDALVNQGSDSDSDSEAAKESNSNLPQTQEEKYLE